MTAQEIINRVMQRTDDENAVQASPAELLAAVNEGQEFASILSLCLQTEVPLVLPAGASFGSILTSFPDYLCPLRLATTSGRLMPSTLADFDAEDDSWQSTIGTPTRYATMGFDLIAVNKQPPANINAAFIYARSPVQMAPNMTPEIPEEYHQSLVKFGKYRVRVKEGAQGLSRAVQDLNRFLDDMTRLAGCVRARSKAAKFDTLPIELQLFDRSRLMPTVGPAQKAAA
jgi:hypothetical protein